MLPVEDAIKLFAMTNQLIEHDLDKVEREAILAALAKTGFNRTAAAKLLGLTFRTLRYRMQRLGIKDPEA